MKRNFTIRLCALVFALLASFALAQTKTTVTDTLHAPDGTLLEGRMIITPTAGFIAADGTVVSPNSSIPVSVTSGVFTVALVPTVGATPANVTYTVTYNVTAARSSETWKVPVSATPLGIADVLYSTTTIPSSDFGVANLIPPTDCAALGGYLFYSGGWTCSAGGSVTSGLTSFNGRTGVVVPASGDYSFSMLSGTAPLPGASQSANTVLAGPSSGVATAPTFRALVAADIPALNYQAVLSTHTSAAHHFLTGFTAPNTFTDAQPTCSDISGAAPSCGTDATNAANITSGTLPDARLSNTVAAGSCTLCSVTYDAHGRITATSNGTAGSSGAFSALTGGTNTSAAMLVGSGASLAPAGTGTVNANEVNGGTIPTSASVLASNSSAQATAASTTGSGSVVLATSPTLVTPNLGTPSALTLTNANSLPVSGITATGSASSATFLRGDGSWSAPSFSNVTGTLSSGQLPATFNATTATALAASGTACSAGNYARGVDASGNATGCTTAALGTVTSVGLTLPSWLTTSGSPVTTSGTLAVSAAGSQVANEVLATPNGTSGAVGLRALVAGDIPALNYQAPLSTYAAPAHSWLTGFTSPNTFTVARPACADLSDVAASCATDTTNAANITSGTFAAARMPALTGDVTTTVGSTATTLANSGVTAGSCTSCNLTIDAKGRVTAQANGSSGGSSYTAQFFQTAAPSQSVSLGPQAGGLGLWAMELPNGLTVNSFTFNVTTADASHNVSYCIFGPFTSAGATTNLVASTAAAAYGATGYQTVAISGGTPATLAPGIYFVGLDMAAGGTFNTPAAGSGVFEWYGNFRFILSGQTGACPASITAPTLTAGESGDTPPIVAISGH